MSTIEAIGHAASIFFAMGFCMFLWQISKGMKKMRKRARKAGKREKKAYGK
jgi:hypothetical protein